MAAFGHPTPIFRIFDEDKAREFYLDFLGFEVVFEHRFEDDMPLYMGIRHGDCVIHLSGHHGDCTPGARIRIPSKGLSEYCAALRAKNYRHARPGEPCEVPWGGKEIGIGDPFGNTLTFFEE